MESIKRLRESKEFAVGVVFLGVFADITVYSVIIPIIPFVLDSIEQPETWVGILLAAYGMGIIAGSALFWLLVEKKVVNKKVGMILSLGVTLAAVLLFAFAQSIAALVCARLLQGISSCGVWVLGLSYVADVYANDQKNFGLVMSIIFSGMSFGQLIGPPVSGWLYGINTKDPYWFCIALVFVDLIGRFLIADVPASPDTDTVATQLDLPSLASANSDTIIHSPALLLVATKERPAALYSIDTLTNIPTTLTSKDVFIARTSDDGVEFSFRNIGRARLLLVTCVFCVIIATCLTQIEPTLPLYLNNRFGYNSGQIGTLWLAFVIPNVFGSVFGGTMYDKYGIRRVCCVAMPAAAIMLGLLAIPGPTDTIAYVACMLAFSGIAFGGVFAPIAPAIAAAVPKEFYVGAYVAMNISYSIGTSVGPIVGAFLYQNIGFMWQMLAFALFLVACIPLIFLMPVSAAPSAATAEISSNAKNNKTRGETLMALKMRNEI
ncbi:hypothetical protein HK100_000506 [Physocladia obscura]|uniref:Major facilitator superfamily (MFS) profile domain-containing protein n=1 Tax=Physocladia obscura TaxID=109957 RepID=A0AAD5XFJ9_9FUNG|nr:hypothetical protein HK100_000506 [Physocladia obscura]